MSTIVLVALGNLYIKGVFDKFVTDYVAGRNA